MSVSNCERDGALDARILAIVRDDGDVEWYLDVRVAYRLDADSGQFVEIRAAGVRCMNEGWGL